MKLVKMYTLLVMVSLVSMLGFAGCAALSGVDDGSKRLAVFYATAKVIDGDQTKAGRIVDLIQEAREYVSGDPEVTISALYEGVVERVNWAALDPADQIIIEAILLEAKARLQEEIGVGLLSPEQRVKVSTVLNWIEAAANGQLVRS